MENRSMKKRTFSTAATKSLLPKISSSSRQPLKQSFEAQLLQANSSLLMSKHKDMQNNRRIATQEVEYTKKKQQNINKFPQFTKHIEKMLQPQIQEVLQMFKTINLLRQKNGLISIKEDWQSDDYYFQSRQLPYNPQLRQMNQQICGLKRQIQDKIARIIKMVKPYPILKHMVQSLLENSVQDALDQNSKTGKTAAMKAHRRLIEYSKTQLKKIGKI